VTIPLLRPAMLSAWTLFFIFFMGEISCTILLYTGKSITDSVGIWNALGMGSSIQAFAFGMVQTTIIFLTLALAYRGGRSHAVLTE
jgi:iron(III) transport system permease protein